MPIDSAGGIDGADPKGVILPDDTEDRKRRKQRWTAVVQRYFANPISRRVARFVPGQALVETTGRVSGQPRRAPVGGRLADGDFWLVSSHGRRAQYVRNIIADPRVRVQIGGHWYSGTAYLLDDDDPHQRMAKLPSVNSAVVRLLGTDLLTIRIDLDDSPN